MNKTSIQELANALGVSRVTVWKVLNNKPGVSPATRSRVVNAAAQLRSGPFGAQTPPDTKIMLNEDQGGRGNAALVVARPESSQFWMKMINQIAVDLSAQQINLIYLCLTIEDLENFKLPPVLQNGGVEGIIVINAYDERVMHLMSECPIPKVYFDGVTRMPLEEMNGDVLLPDGRYSVCQITRRLLSGGRDKLGFLGDVSYAYSNHQRWLGFLDAHEETRSRVDARLCMTGSIGVNDYKAAVRQYFDNLPFIPGGIVCVSDFIAQLVCEELEKRGVEVPGQTAVSGYDDSTEFHATHEKLTTVRVQNEQIGRRLVQQLLYRMNNPRADYEVVLLHSQVLYRESTRIGPALPIL